MTRLFLTICFMFALACLFAGTGAAFESCGCTDPGAGASASDRQDYEDCLEQCDADNQRDEEESETVLPTDIGGSDDEGDAEGDSAAAGAAVQQYQTQDVQLAIQCVKNCWDEVVDSYELCVRSTTTCLIAVPVSRYVPGVGTVRTSSCVSVGIACVLYRTVETIVEKCTPCG